MSTLPDSDDAAKDNQLEKRPKRKVAIVFGYVGERYCGLQWNHLPDHPTVEEELLRAMRKTNMISEENYAQDKVQQKLNWERTSRTDKGVHALRNVVSLNAMLPYSKNSADEFDLEEAKRLLNDVLPPDIVIYEVVPVTRSFNAYMLCGGRTYEYYLPTFAFMSPEEYREKYFPPAIAPSHPTLEEAGHAYEKSAGQFTPVVEHTDDGPGERKRQRENDTNDYRQGAQDELGARATSSAVEPCSSERGNKGSGNAVGDKSVDMAESQKLISSPFEKMLVFRTIPECVMKDVARYRITLERLEHARQIFRLYEGTHSFHNFTPGGRGNDPSSSRYITSVTVSEPFTVHPTDPQLELALKTWTPQRYYSPDGEQLVNEREACDSSIEEQRQRVRSHMLHVYGGTDGEEGVNSNCSSEDCSNCSGVSGLTPATGHVCGGLEVVRIELCGQSFMFNQIRKMIGTVAAMCVAGLPPEYLRQHFLNKAIRCGTPMAPANGLFLTYLDFQRYNYRLERIQTEGQNGIGKKGLHVDRVDEGAVAEFRRKIVAVILRNEMAIDGMGRWMRSLRHVLRLACGIELP
ncbi:putative tRNA pseudouridine synthase [Trypanosoma vivax]|nr:tRNA pseudouridine38-40 synthase [Trypanosoma vivax]KAH8608278.1 putative tRNA pseudouridine synthase [Trypanosoma vivax]